MISGATRVAPEKAVFRPALLRLQQPGLPEKHMAERKPYWELLRDPRWQKKRLEVMERAKFACEICGDKTTTLNVHHKFYQKGAKPWEYEDRSLQCLCEPCHKSVTEIRSILDSGIGGLSLDVMEMTLGFVHGQLIHQARIDGHFDPNFRLPCRNDFYVLGLARFFWVKTAEIDERIEGWHDDGGIPIAELLELGGWSKGGERGG